MTVRLDVPLQVTLDGSGNGSVAVTVPWGQRWQVTTITTKTNQAVATTPYPIFRVYRGAATDANLIAATYSGQQDTAAGNELFMPGETVTVAWSAGVAASVATAHLIGTVEALSAMEFGNPLVGGLILIREAIRSPNYVAGSTGWTINRDGSVEFGTGTFRGVVAIGNATYLVKLGDEFGRLQFLNGGGTVEHAALYDASSSQVYSVLLIARNFNSAPAEPPGASIQLSGDNDTVSTGPQIVIATHNPEARPNERIDLQSTLVRVLANLTVSGTAVVTGNLSTSGNLTVSGAGVNNISGATNLNNNTAVTGTLNVTGATSIGGRVATSAGQVYAEYNQPSALWSDGTVVASNASGGNAALVLRTSTYAAQARLGTGANDVYWRNYDDSAYIGHQAAAYTVASREATKSSILEMAGDTLARIRRLRPITFRRRVPDSPPGADRIHLAHPSVRELGPAEAARVVEAIEESSVTHAGFTVENVADAFPEAIVLGEDGKPAAYDLAAMVAALTHAVQQLDARLSTLESPPSV